MKPLLAASSLAVSLVLTGCAAGVPGASRPAQSTPPPAAAQSTPDAAHTMSASTPTLAPVSRATTTTPPSASATRSASTTPRRPASAAKDAAKAPLVLGPASVGPARLGSATLDELYQPLVGKLGKPQKVTEGGCPMAGESFTTLQWGGLTIDFDNDGDRTLTGWALNTKVDHPPVRLADDWPLRPTAAQLKQRDPSIKVTSLFGGGAPYVATSGTLSYQWEGSSSQPSDHVSSPLRTCE